MSRKQLIHADAATGTSATAKSSAAEGAARR